MFGSIDDHPPLVEDAVRRVTEATGMAPLLIGHSMGGWPSVPWLRAYQSDARMHHAITLGTPHGGTWPGPFQPDDQRRQMRLGGEWVRQLQAAAEPSGRAARFTCWYSNCDNIVFPASTATLAGASNRLLEGWRMWIWRCTRGDARMSGCAGAGWF